jgi:hypothetical protein
MWDVNEEPRINNKVLKRVGEKFQLSQLAQDLAHNYVLNNVPCLAPWVEYVYFTLKITL